MLNFATKKLIKTRRWGIETILSVLAIALVTGIFLKAIFDVDTNYDPGWYHLPFAARLGGIVPESMFVGDEKWFEPRFDGFPLLAHLLQGILWRITGRMQSTNLVGFCSIIGYLFFLNKFWQIPLYLSAIALFSVPLVLIHASTSYVDLIGNVGVSILVMTVYGFYKNSRLPSKSELFIACFGAAIAANTKTQLQPLVLVILLVAGVRIGLLLWNHKVNSKQIFKISSVALLASLVIYASPIKNMALYGNPLYPIKVQIGNIVLNHKLSPEAYEEGNRQQNWLESVLGTNAPKFWSADQWSKDPSRSRRGGFFGLYVVFNVLLLWGFFVGEFVRNKTLPLKERSNEARIAVLTAIAMSLVPLNFPQSHELRYFMYWIITLVSLNLYLICLPHNKQLFGRWLQPKYMGLVFAVFLMIVLVRTDAAYAKPSFVSQEQYVKFGVRQAYLDQIRPNEKVCIIARHMGEDVQKQSVAALKYAFVHSAYFHPHRNNDYAIQIALDEQSCGDLRIIPNDVRPEDW